MNATITIESRVFKALRQYAKLQMYEIINKLGAQGYTRNDVAGMVGKWADEGRLARTWDDLGEVYYNLPQ